MKKYLAFTIILIGLAFSVKSNPVFAINDENFIMTSEFSEFNFFGDVWGIRSTDNLLEYGLYETHLLFFFPAQPNAEESVTFGGSTVESLILFYADGSAIDGSSVNISFNTYIYAEIPAEADSFNINIVSDQINLTSDLTNMKNDFNDLTRSYNIVQQIDLIDVELTESYDLGYQTAKSEWGLFFEDQWRTATYMYQEGLTNGEGFGLGWVVAFFSVLGMIFGIELLPNLYIGTIVGIPIIFGVTFFVIKWVRGG